MEYLGIKLNVENIPELDPGFIPLYKFNQDSQHLSHYMYHNLCKNNLSSQDNR